MKINIIVKPQEYADLCKKIVENRERWENVFVPGAEKAAGQFINIKRCQLSPPFEIEVELEVRERCELIISGSRRSISRCDIDEIWDILGVFPRSGVLPEEIAEPLKLILQAVDAITSTNAVHSREIGNSLSSILVARKRLEERLKKLL